MTTTPVAHATSRGASAVRAVSLRFVVLVVGAVLTATGLVHCLAGGATTAVTRSWAFDFDLNFVAAQRLVDREPLYDADAARKEGVRDVGTRMEETGHDQLSRYIGLPPVALSHVPFLLFGADHAAQWFRLVSLLGMIAAVLLTAWSLSPPARAPAALVGFGVLLWAFPLVRALALGQGTGMVMLALAAGIWGSARERWGVAGVGFGIATVLKVSPVLFVAYLLLRGHHRVWKSALATVIGACALAAAVGRPGDLIVWLTRIGPSVSKGTLSLQNQSVVGALARLTTGHDDLFRAIGTGRWYLLAYVAWGAGLVGLWWCRRRKRLDVLELGVLVLVILFAGPLTWDHYFAWAVLPAVLIADPARWRGRNLMEVAALAIALGCGLALCSGMVPHPLEWAVRLDWWLRVTTISYTAAAVLFTTSAVWLLVREPEARRGETALVSSTS
jgi:alpha-1,2-mannosyltransferase